LTEFVAHNKLREVRGFAFQGLEFLGGEIEVCPPNFVVRKFRQTRGEGVVPLAVEVH